MRRLVPTLLAAVLLLHPVARAAGAVDPAQLTRRFAAELRRALPGCEVKVVRDLELKVIAKDKVEHTVFLDNLLAEAQQDPGEVEAAISRRLAATAEVVGAREAPLDRDRIVPVIKDRAWLDQVASQAKGKDGKGLAAALVWEAYNPELVVLYAIDRPQNMQYLTPDALRRMGLSKRELRPLAVRNLMRILPGIELHPGDGLHMITAGGSYESSLLLADPIWDSGQVKVSGEYVVAVPARDLLLVTGSKDAKAIAKLRKMAAEAAAEASYSLVPTLFVRRGGKFQRM